MKAQISEFYAQLPNIICSYNYTQIVFVKCFLWLNNCLVILFWMNNIGLRLYALKIKSNQFRICKSFFYKNLAVAYVSTYANVLGISLLSDQYTGCYNFKIILFLVIVTYYYDLFFLSLLLPYHIN